MLNRPFGVFVTPNGEVYFSDRFNHRVRKILCDGRIVTIAGTGVKGFSGDGGPATDARLNHPLGIFVSSNDEIYISDYYNYRIRKILKNGTIITITGTGYRGSSSDEEEHATNANITRVEGLFVAQNDEVYFSDFSNNRIRKILSNGKLISVAGCGSEGYNGDGELATRACLNCPSGVFVSNNGEIYIADCNNNVIRKVLENGTILTIAGTGDEGFSGDGQLAIDAQLNRPSSLFVTRTNEVYISDFGRIRKILKNGNIITIAGTGVKGFSGDNGPAISAQISNVESIFVSSNNEIYLADSENHRIRKILRNGNIITIAGNGKRGYSGDSPFDFSLNPHFGSQVDNISTKKLKKHSRDEIFGFELIGFVPLIEKLSPQFCKIILKNEKILKSMNSQHLQIIQKLIDSLIYENHDFTFDDYLLDILFILGMFKNCEFINEKENIVRKFLNTITLESVSLKWEQIEKYLKLCDELSVKNYIIEALCNYCLEFASIQLKTKYGCEFLKNEPIIVRNSTNIISMLPLTVTSPIEINEEIEVEIEQMASLFNDEKTSDVKIKMGNDRYLYCHKTILSSKSIFFNALFESGSNFSDLTPDGIFTPDESEDLDALEIVIKYCYGILDIDTDNSTDILVTLLDMALKHEITYLINYCMHRFILSIDNYFEMACCFEKYFHLDCFSTFRNQFITFGISNRAKLFTDTERVRKLPPTLLHEMFVNLSCNNI